MSHAKGIGRCFEGRGTAKQPFAVELAELVVRVFDETDELVRDGAQDDVDGRRPDRVRGLEGELGRRAARPMFEQQRRLAVEQLLAVAVDGQEHAHSPSGAAEERDGDELEGGGHVGMLPASSRRTMTAAPRVGRLRGVVGRSTSKVATVVLAALLLAGCGEPRTVTYVDPNGPNAGVRAGDGGEPVRRHGVAASERAVAAVRVRSALAVARTVAVTDPDAASEVIRRSIEEDLPLLEARAAASEPPASRALRSGLERLRDTPPRDIAGYNREVRRLSDVVLVQVTNAAVPIAARQDVSFRSSVLYETLLAAATSYEASFEGGSDEIVLDSEYRIAYGLLIDARTRQLEAIPEDARPRIRTTLDRVSRRATNGPTPPSEPPDPDVVLGDLSALADEVAVAARIDPTWPPPDPSTPDRLRSLKQLVGAAVEAHERGASADALGQLRDADRTVLLPAAAGIAAVSVTLLAELEHGVIIELPAAIRADADVTNVAAELDRQLDETIALVEEELELLRDSS